MRKFNLLLLIFVLCACHSSKKMTDDEAYSYLLTCFSDYYDNYNVSIVPLLNQFEQRLLKEGHLTDTTGVAYKQLFKKLDNQIYFHRPLKKKHYNKVVLLQSPSNLIYCTSTVFSIDSARIYRLPFSAIQRKINNYSTQNDSLSIHYFFSTYAYNISVKDYRKPYIKQTLLLFLYRWYYQSKAHIKENMNIQSSKNR